MRSWSKHQRCKRSSYFLVISMFVLNSFENLGRTMVDVLTMQQQTNLTLQDQVRRANDAQMEETLAMHDLADMTETENI